MSARPPSELDARPLAPSRALRRRVLASLEPATRFEGLLARVAAFLDLAPGSAREVLAAADAVAGSAWVAAPVPGVRLFHFRGGPRVASADCGLVHLASRTVFPRHRHLGDEWNFALAGSAQEDGGELWEPGDIVLRPAGSAHGFRALGEEPFLFAVVLHGGIAPVDE